MQPSSEVPTSPAQPALPRWPTLIIYLFLGFGMISQFSTIIGGAALMTNGNVLYGIGDIVIGVGLGVIQFVVLLGLIARKNSSRLAAMGLFGLMLLLTFLTMIRLGGLEQLPIAVLFIRVAALFYCIYWLGAHAEYYH